MNQAPDAEHGLAAFDRWLMQDIAAEEKRARRAIEEMARARRRASQTTATTRQEQKA